MGIFSKLFGKEPKDEEQGGKTALTGEQFIAKAYVQDIVGKYKRATVLLQPQTATQALSPYISKFGGMADMNGFNAYPCCDGCGTPEFVPVLYLDGCR